MAGGFLGGNKKEIILLIETKVGNKFLARADEKGYEKFVKQTNKAAVKSRDDIAIEEFTTTNKSESQSESESESEESDFISELERLASLKEKRLLTVEEFVAAKAKLLNS